MYLNGLNKRHLTLLPTLFGQHGYEVISYETEAKVPNMCKAAEMYSVLIKCKPTSNFS